MCERSMRHLGARLKCYTLTVYSSLGIVYGVGTNGMGYTREHWQTHNVAIQILLRRRHNK